MKLWSKKFIVGVHMSGRKYPTQFPRASTHIALSTSVRSIAHSTTSEQGKIRALLEIECSLDL
jgi:hypothetical protein